MKLFTILMLIFVCASCGMIPQRSYLAEMEEDDSSFFEPRKDFPVVPGDTGRDFRSKKEWRKRTPASASTRLKEREEISLKNELARLEASQSEGALAHYQQFKPRLGSVSEKIYFLQLKSKNERDEYLAARGLSESSAPIAQSMTALFEHDQITLGMTKEEVESYWGRPERVDIAGNPNFENERWLYRHNGAAKYVFFEAGKVGGWSTASR
ncbi:MAG: outer membrane protein assembly factor BamE [Bacteriovoracaceae bacterium]|nr:outer membrane protein assembly factor BamE [Bacteriovoracaceae bacterium]